MKELKKGPQCARIFHQFDRGGINDDKLVWQRKTASFCEDGRVSSNQDAVRASKGEIDRDFASFICWKCSAFSDSEREKKSLTGAFGISLSRSVGVGGYGSRASEGGKQELVPFELSSNTCSLPRGDVDPQSKEVTSTWVLGRLMQNSQSDPRTNSGANYCLITAVRVHLSKFQRIMKKSTTKSTHFTHCLPNRFLPSIRLFLTQTTVAHQLTVVYGVPSTLKRFYDTFVCDCLSESEGRRWESDEDGSDVRVPNPTVVFSVFGVGVWFGYSENCIREEEVGVPQVKLVGTQAENDEICANFGNRGTPDPAQQLSLRYLEPTNRRANLVVGGGLQAFDDCVWSSDISHIVKLMVCGVDENVNRHFFHSCSGDL